MCGLCSSDDKERTDSQHHHAAIADRIDRVAMIYRSMSRGILKPHSEELKAKIPTIHMAIRQLVEDWV